MSPNLRVSFELYPPRRPEATESTWATVRQLAEWEPDCFSVTYPSTSSGRDASYVLVKRILAETDITPVAHLTVTGASRAALKEHVRWLFGLGVRDVLALRGDPPYGEEWTTFPGGLDYASELIELVREVERENGTQGVDVGCAVSPQASPEGLAAEVRTLLAKQDAGAGYAITQVYYEADHYVRLVDDARSAGVTIPIVPGIIPLTDPARLQRLAALTGVSVPASIASMTDADDDERFDLGIELTADLVEASVAAGADRIHVFTFNQALPATALCAELADRGILHPLPLKGLA